MALNVDWNYIQALFVQGFGPQQISDKTGVKPGTIRSRAVRYNWYELRAKAQLPVACPVPKSLDLADSKALALESQRTQARLSRIIANQVTALESHEPVTYRDLQNTPKREGYTAITGRVIQQAAKLYGWDAQSQPAPMMNLTQINVTPASEIKPGETVIDVPYE